MRSPGANLLELCQTAQYEVVLVAPFMKVRALEAVLGAIPENVTSIKCVTRWRPEEIVAGVSDLEVFNLVTQRSAAALFIQPLLHAKYFRADNSCLVGSANLTQSALGWAMPANLELLISLPSDTESLPEFERMLFSTSIRASQTFKNEVAKAAETMQGEGIKFVTEELGAEEEEISIPPQYWLPLCTRPDLLYSIYVNRNIDQIVGWTLESGRRDIRALCIPPGLSEKNFRRYVATLLQQSPLAQRVYEKAREPISPTKGQEFIKSNATDDYLLYSAEQHWETLRAWLLHFLSGKYRQLSGSFDLQRGSEIGSMRF
ncbi:hypothetical protein Nhal_0082 [Nitrosococcus halophilus Nc 4]|uniref:PLD phosphodiesterase domain-containing protein n=1 Tax=Nitrosococcus halophilus (strain Nc4) TaxID=472759 RepID=D5C4B4_NITHN|nr:phospholipase D family protein [Nitrosococcus halophilus]ADE13302.1 hypothetical protein Nhal_0082 [Nitrosococcus halophilus Nc 4]